MLGAVVFLLARQLPNLSPQGESFLGTLVFISFFWAILNLLPVVPLDGGQMLNAILGPDRIKVTLWISIVVAIVTGLLVFKFTNSSPIFPIFLGMFAWQAFQALKEQR